MRVTGRKLTMQLTPLLDLLLIVIFAQYMDVRENANAATAGVEALQQELQSARDENTGLRTGLQQASRLLSDANTAMAASQSLIQRQQAERLRLSESLAQSLTRQRLLGQLVVDLFDIATAIIDTLLDPNRIPPLGESTQEFERFREHFRQMAAANPSEMVRHLLTYEEIRKRCDVWELHLQQSPRELVLESDGERRGFPLPVESTDEFAALDATAFERHLYEELKALPQPKGLVIVTLTYDADLRRILLEPAQRSIERIIDRLRVEATGRSQFEFADLGVPVR